MPKQSKPLSDAAIRALKPTAKRFEVRDGLRPGLALRVEPDGRRTWTFRYGDRGTRRVTLGPLTPAFGLAKARAAANRVLAQVSEGRDPAAERAEVRQREREARADARARETGKPLPGSFADLAVRYLRDAEKRFRPSSWRKERWYVERCILPSWGVRPAAELRRADVLRLHDEVREGRGGVTANRTLAVARRVLAWGVDREELDANPAAAVPRRYLFAERPRERVLTAAEVRALWLALDDLHPTVAAAWRLILLTAARPGEVLGMRWDDLHREDRKGTVWEIPAERAKSGATHRVPLSQHARAVLEAVRPLSNGEGFVLPSPKGGDRPLRWLSHSTMRLRVAAARILELEELPPFTPHDCRRTAATWLGEAGVRPDVIERVLGHKLPGVAAVYNRAEYLREVRRALDLLGERIEEAVTGRARANVARFPESA